MLSSRLQRAKQNCHSRCTFGWSINKSGSKKSKYDVMRNDCIVLLSCNILYNNKLAVEGFLFLNDYLNYLSFAQVWESLYTKCLPACSVNTTNTVTVTPLNKNLRGNFFMSCTGHPVDSFKLRCPLFITLFFTPFVMHGQEMLPNLLKSRERRQKKDWLHNMSSCEP